MPGKRFQKRAFYFISILLLTVVIGYFLRYQIVFRFQYSRLQSLSCKTDTGCMQILWAHRVNSLPRYDWLKDKMTGFETDIVFNDSSRNFSVYHPPLNIEGDTLSFDKFLSHVDLQQKRYWIDTRNVGYTNALEALSALQATGKAELMKKACIFELYDLVAAEQFALAGYSTSFNVSHSVVRKMKNEPSFRDSINKHLQQVKYVSQESNQLGEIKKLFPHKRIITWHLTFMDYFRLSRLQNIVNDPQVDIVLVNIKSPYFR